MLPLRALSSQEGLPAKADELTIRPFYAALPFDDQMKALEPSRVKRNGQAVRKCVLATNIAETSVTIPGVVFVVDSGFVKVLGGPLQLSCMECAL